MASMLDKAKEFVADKIANIPMPEASLDSLTFKGMTTEAITVHSHVNVTNPYSYRIPIGDIAYVLKCGGTEVASGTIPDPGWIEESGEVTKLEVPAKVPYDVVITLIKDLGRDWDIDYELDVKITIDLPIIGNLTIPLKTAGEFKLPTLSDFFFGDNKEVAADAAE